MATGGRQFAGFGLRAKRRKAGLAEIPRVKVLLAATVASIALLGTPGAICGAADRAEQATLERFHVGRIHADDVGNAAGQDVAENSEASAQDGLGLELPRDRGARLKNRERRGRKYIAEAGLNRGVERLIHVVRDGIERAAQARRCADADSADSNSKCREGRKST